MTPVELTNTLVDMGVDPTRAELAAKKFGECKLPRCSLFGFARTLLLT